MNLPHEAGTPDQYGVVGHPVAHSWSPFIHGMFAKAAAQNLVYRLFDITAGRFSARDSAPADRRRARPQCHVAAQAGGRRTGQRADAARGARAGGQHHRLLRGYDAARRQHRRRRPDRPISSTILGIALADKRVLILGAGGAARGVRRPACWSASCARSPSPTAPRTRRASSRPEFSDLGQIIRLHFRRDRGPALRSHHQRHLGEPAGRDAGAAGRTGRAKRPFATTWPTAAGIRPSRCGRDRCTPARISKGWGMLVEQAAESFLLWRGIRPEHAAVLAGAGAARLSASCAGASSRLDGALQRMVTSSSALVG